MKLSEIVAGYIAAQPAGIVLDGLTVTRCLKDAVRFFCGFASIKDAPPTDADEDPYTAPFHSNIAADNEISGAQDFDLTPSEYAIIMPLFKLYIERDNAMHLEASRGLGVDVYGRSSSEVAADIKEAELEMPKKSFFEPILSVL